MRRFFVVLAALLLTACQQEGLSYDGKVVSAPWSGPSPKDGWESVLSVRASTAADSPPLAGRYERKRGRVVFVPAYPPSPEVTLYIRFREPQDKVREPVLRTLIIPGKAPPRAPATVVQAVYPTTNQWPANQLKFYVQFSGPMSKGVAYRHIRLLDDAGRIVPEPFVEFDQELWDPAVTRLTVLFDPGRIKRGLGDTDPPLVAGRSYTLVVDAAFPDAQGRALSQGLERRIQVVPEVRQPVDPKTWKVTWPRDQDAPLVIDFPRPLDNALARRTISVIGVEGQVDLMNDETRWVFRPERPWKRGEYQIRVDGILEDLAGNRLHRLFDVDTSDPTQTKAPPKFETLAFRVD